MAIYNMNYIIETEMSKRSLESLSETIDLAIRDIKFDMLAMNESEGDKSGLKNKIKKLISTILGWIKKARNIIKERILKAKSQILSKVKKDSKEKELPKGLSAKEYYDKYFSNMTVYMLPPLTKDNVTHNKFTDSDFNSNYSEKLIIDFISKSLGLSSGGRMPLSDIEEKLLDKPFDSTTLTKYFDEIEKDLKSELNNLDKSDSEKLNKLMDKITNVKHNNEMCLKYFMKNANIYISIAYKIA